MWVFINVVIMAKVVDLPAPFGPIILKISPLDTSKLTSSIAVILALLELNSLVRSMTSIMGSNKLILLETNKNRKSI